MIQKIKGLVKIGEEIDSLKGKFDDTHDNIESFKKKVDLLHEKFDCHEKKLDELHSNQTEFLDNFKDNLDMINGLKKELENEIYDFKLIKSQIKNKIVEKFEEELSNELKLNLETLKEDLNNYNEIKNSIGVVLNDILPKSIHLKMGVSHAELTT